MTEKQYKWLKRAADFFLPLLDAVLMAAVMFAAPFELPMKIILLIVILLIGNVLKYELKKKLAHWERQRLADKTEQRHEQERL